MMTHQEMFDRAVRGLASQGWRRCVQRGSNGLEDYYYNNCEYTLWPPGGGVMHCAWGWVDPATAGVGSVANSTVRSPVYAELTSDGDREFALALQRTHDESSNANLRQDFRKLAADYGLSDAAMYPDVAS